MSEWMTDEQIAELKRQRPLSGNDFIDAYMLGYEAGEREGDARVSAVENANSDMFWEKRKIEQERDSLVAENVELKAKLKKLKKKLKSAGIL